MPIPADPDYRPNYTTARSRVYCPRLRADRTVTLDSRAMPRDHRRPLMVQGPTDPGTGARLTIRVLSGMHKIHVLGGEVTVELSSGWGNVLYGPPDPDEAQRLQVIAGHDAKCTLYDVPDTVVTVRPGARVRYYAGPTDQRTPWPPTLSS